MQFSPIAGRPLTREGVAEAIGLAHRALELEPRFGLVAALAGVRHMQNVLWGYAIDPQFERKEAVRLARLALSIDDGDPDILALAAVTPAYMIGDPESEIRNGGPGSRAQPKFI